MKQKEKPTYFPIKIRFEEGENKGKEAIVSYEDIPTGVSFVVLQTNAMDKEQCEEAVKYYSK